MAEWVAAEGGGAATPRGGRETRSVLERGEEPDRGLGAGSGVRIPGLYLSSAPLPAGPVVGAEDAGHQAADGVAAEAQGSVPALALSAGGPGDRSDQSDPAGLGELLPSRERGTVLWVREGMGREEGAAPSDAGEESSGLRLEAVEYTARIYTTLGVFNDYRVRYQIHA